MIALYILITQGEMNLYIRCKENVQLEQQLFPLHLTNILNFSATQLLSSIILFAKKKNVLVFSGERCPLSILTTQIFHLL